jgi:heme exporter protein A
MSAAAQESAGSSGPETGSSAITPVLQVRELACERDDRQLFEGLNFDLFPGELVQLKGRNGSGKTTLLRILCGLNSGYSGEIFFRGLPADEVAEEFRAALCYLGHRVGVNKVLTPVENLRWAGQLASQFADAKARDERIMAALQEVGLRGFEFSQCHTLSAGQQQRVAIARLLLSNASLWLLDEPFTTLDVDAVAELERRLEQHAAAGGAVMVTTHHELRVANLRVIQL